MSVPVMAKVIQGFELPDSADWGHAQAFPSYDRNSVPDFFHASHGTSNWNLQIGNSLILE